jgi:hypothetical protein
MKPGLNIFDAQGNELDWDYEHDTRFFEPSAGESDRNGKNGEKESEDKEDETFLPAADPQGSGGSSMGINVEADLGGVKVRSRGRGAKKFLNVFGEDDEQQHRSTLMSERF